MKFKIEGLQELDGALRTLIESTSSATAKNALKRGMMKAGEPVAEHARQLVPVHRGVLKRAIKVSGKLANPTGKSEFRAALRRGEGQEAAVAALRNARRESEAASTIEVYIGPGQRPHAHLVEFGSVHNTPQPYMRPAWEAGRDRVAADMKAAVTEEFEKAAARAARKAAKRAGGG